MALMMGKLHEALVSAGVEPAKAQEVASFENQIGALRTELASFRVEVRSEFTLLKWMVGGIIALNVAMLPRMIIT